MFRRYSPPSFAALLTAVAFASLGGCSVNYQNHHRSDLLQLYHNSTETHSHPELDPAWAEMALVSLANGLGIDLDGVAPVRVFIDCDPESNAGSYFNRLTDSVLLRKGQAEIRHLFLHEVAHLLIDQIDGSPSYWVDQGLAEYMETRAPRRVDGPGIGLLPPHLEVDVALVRDIGKTTDEDLLRHTSQQAIDEGWSWVAPLIHYLLRHRWAEWPLPSRVRRLLELREDDLREIAAGFRAFCLRYEPVEEFYEDYERTSGDVRMLLLTEVGWRFPGSYQLVLERLHEIERAPRWRRVLARLILTAEKPAKVGATFERLAPSLGSEPIPELGLASAEALMRFLIAERDIDPDYEWFHLVAPFLARSRAGAVPPDKAVAWFLGWPRRATEFAARREVQEYVLPRLAQLDEPVFQEFLAGSPLARFESSGIFAREGWPLRWWVVDPRAAAGTVSSSSLLGALRFENAVVSLVRLEPSERLAARRRLETFLQRRNTAPGEQRTRARAAVLRAYLGGPLDLRVLDRALEANHADIVAFACSFLAPAQRHASREYVNSLLAVDRIGGSAFRLDDIIDNRVFFFAPHLGLSGYRSRFREVLGQLREPERSRHLAAAAFFHDPSLGLGVVSSMLRENQFTDAMAFYLQLTLGFDFCLDVEPLERGWEIRVKPGCDVEGAYDRWKLALEEMPLTGDES